MKIKLEFEIGDKIISDTWVVPESVHSLEFGYVESAVLSLLYRCRPVIDWSLNEDHG